MRVLSTTLLFACLTACTDLSGYQLEEGQVFRGPVFRNDDVDCAPGEPCSFIRRGFIDGAELDVVFDPARAETNPGTLTTRGGLCDPVFTDEPLLPIVPLAHDPLSLYEIPGAGRVENFMFTIHPSRGPLAGRDAMAFLSLLRNGEMEVRIIAGAGRNDCAADDCDAFARGECDFFGVFTVRRTTP